MVNGTCTSETGMKNALPGGRRRAELGGQLQAPAQRPLRGRVHPPRSRGRWRRAWAPPTGPTTTSSSQPRGPALDHAYLGLGAHGRERSAASSRSTTSPTSGSPTTRSSSTTSPTPWPTARSRVGCAGASSGARAPRFSRSIIADPRKAEMKEKLNAKIKFREAFRPFAPSVLEERADEFFEIPEAQRHLAGAVHAVRGPGARGEARRAARRSPTRTARAACRRSTRRPTPAITG